MSSDGGVPGTTGPERWLIAVLLAVAGNALVLGFDVGGVLGDGGTLRFWDQDSYSRLLRLRALMDGGGWYDSLLTSLNAPFGLVMHWTRPLDALLVPPAALLGLWMNRTSAVELAAAGIGPVLEVAALAVLFSALGRSADRRLVLLAGALFVLQRSVAYRFAIGQADHHHLIVLLHLATLAPLLRAASAERPGIAPLLAGVAAALGLWVSPGGAMTLAVALLGLGVAWLHDGDARLLRRFADGLLLAAPLALFIERTPSDWASVEYDRYSVVHVALAVAVFIAAQALARLPGWLGIGDRVAPRAALALLVGFGVGGVLLAGFPHLVSSPLSEFGAEVARWTREIGELRPTLPRDWQQVPVFAADMAPGLVALLWSATRLARAGAAQRRRRLMESTMLALLTVAAMYLARAQELLLALAPLAWAEALLALLTVGGGTLFRRLTGGLAALLMVVTSWVGGYTLAALGVWEIRKPEGCEYERVAAVLAGATEVGQSILADVNAGPEVAWRTGRGVLAVLNHRNDQGMRDASTLYFSRGDDAAALAMVERRRIGAVVFCRRLSVEDRATLQAAPDILYSRLLTARAPAWLEPLPVPPAVAGQFAVYRVVAVP